jgi:hypothetical protein
MLNAIKCKNLVRTSNKTQYFTITVINSFTPFKDTIYTENLTETLNTK